MLLRFLNFFFFFNESNSLSAFSCQVYNLLSIFWDCHWQHIPLLSFSHDLHKEKIVDSLSCLFFSSSVQLVNYLLEWIHGKKKKKIMHVNQVCKSIQCHKLYTVILQCTAWFRKNNNSKKKQKKKKQFRRTVQMDLITWKHFLSGASTQLQFLDNVALKILKTKFLV